MIFGIKEKRYNLGSFSSDKCTACKKSDTYSFIRVVRYFVAFWINLVPLGTRFEGVCEGCNDVTRIDKSKGAQIARTRFGGANAAAVARSFGKLALLVVLIAAAVVLPIMLTGSPTITPEEMKALVSEDGQYAIENVDGEIYGYVLVSGESKSILYYTEKKALTGEPGAAGMTLYYNFYEKTYGTETVLARVPDDVGHLEDRNGVLVRSYFYDMDAGGLGYSLGVTDLTAIKYSPGKAVYPFMQYTNRGEMVSFVRVLHDNGSRRVLATFDPTSAEGSVLHLSSVVVSEFENGRQISESVYDLSSSAASGDELTLQTPVTQESTADEIVAYLNDNDILPLYTETYEYFENTKVMTAITLSLTTSDGMVQSNSQAFNVVQSGPYYIVSAIGE